MVYFIHPCWHPRHWCGRILQWDSILDRELRNYFPSPTANAAVCCSSPQTLVRKPSDNKVFNKTGDAGYPKINPAMGTTTRTPTNHLRKSLQPPKPSSKHAPDESAVLHSINTHTHICEVYIDDMLIFGSNDDNFVNNTRTVFQRCRKRNVTLNAIKVIIGFDTISFVGHGMDAKGINVSQKWIEITIAFCKPPSQKELQSLMG